MLVTRPPRDSQRSRVYAAETAMNWRGHGRLVSKKLRSLDDAAHFVTEVVTSDWFAARAPQVSLVRLVAGDPKSRRATCISRIGKVPGTTNSRIRLPPWARTRPVILHELSHAVVFSATPPSAHGPEFCRAELDLITAFLGSSVADALHEQFLLHRVRVGSADTPARAIPLPIALGQLVLPGLEPFGQRAASTLPL
jgi:putative metallohydrolase (TIGR04338 family)